MEDNNVNQAILKELKNHTRYLRQGTVMSIIAVVALIAFISISAYRVLTITKGHEKKSEKKVDILSWDQVGSLTEQGNYDEALRIAHSLLQKTASDWYSNSYVASVYLAKGDLANAEKYYATAYRLFPSEDNEKMLTAVRKRINSEKRKGK